MYSKIHSRLDWFFGYIGEPEDDFVVELYGDVNFDGVINVQDINLIVNFVLNITIPTDNQLLAADISENGIVNIQDIILVVQHILGVSFRGAVDWLKENYPELEVEKRLSNLNKLEYFSK